jgi:hypothetical protein
MYLLVGSRGPKRGEWQGMPLPLRRLTSDGEKAGLWLVVMRSSRLCES